MTRKMLQPKVRKVLIGNRTSSSNFTLVTKITKANLQDYEASHHA